MLPKQKTALITQLRLKENNMNFTDLYKKIKSLDEGHVVPVTMLPPSEPKEDYNNEHQVGAFSDDDKQQSMRELLSQLDRIDQPDDISYDGDHGHDGAHEVVYGDMEEEFDAKEKFHANTTPDPTTFDMSAVFPTGHDLASKGKGALKHNGGENPMHEALKGRLTQMYNDIKEEMSYELLHAKKTEPVAGQMDQMEQLGQLRDQAQEPWLKRHYEERMKILQAMRSKQTTYTGNYPNQYDPVEADPKKWLEKNNSWAAKMPPDALPPKYEPSINIGRQAIDAIKGSVGLRTKGVYERSTK